MRDYRRIPTTLAQLEKSESHDSPTRDHISREKKKECDDKPYK